MPQMLLLKGNAGDENKGALQQVAPLMSQHNTAPEHSLGRAANLERGCSKRLCFLGQGDS